MGGYVFTRVHPGIEGFLLCAYCVFGSLVIGLQGSVSLPRFPPSAPNEKEYFKTHRNGEKCVLYLYRRNSANLPDGIFFYGSSLKYTVLQTVSLTST